MWLLPPDFPLRPLRLAPDRRALPWYATEHEVEQLMELLRRMVPEIKEWVRVPWSALERLSGRSEVREGAALVLEAPKGLDEPEARAVVNAVKWPYVFWRPTAPNEEQGAWLEREVKRALLSELRRGLANNEHPLHEVGVEKLPVDLTAAATDDPVELLAIVQATVMHRLQHVDEGLGLNDWTYSVKRAIGEQLAARLGRLKKSELTQVLELVLSEGQRPSDPRAETARCLQAVGLGLCVGENVALGPLARSASDPVTYGVLLERLATAWWPKEVDGHRFMRPVSLGSRDATLPPPTRIAGPMVLHYPKIVWDVWAGFNKLVESLPGGKEAATQLLNNALHGPLLLNHWPDRELKDSIKEQHAQHLRLLDQVRLGAPKQRAFVSLLRLLVEPTLVDFPVDIDAYLLRLDAIAAAVGSPNHNAIKLFAVILLLAVCQNAEQLYQLIRVAGDEWQSLDKRPKRPKYLISCWLAVLSEAYRLAGFSAASVRLNSAAENGSNVDSEYYRWLFWNYARALREAGHEAEAFLRLTNPPTRPGHNEHTLDSYVSLELAQIALDRGSAARARQYYREIHERGPEKPSSRPDTVSRPLLYSMIYDTAAQLIEGTTAELETRLLEVESKANAVDDTRLSMLVHFVQGDLLIRTNRYDGARRSYARARAQAERLGDHLAVACSFEKFAHLEALLGRREDAVAALAKGAEVDSTTEHHFAAERQLRRAAELNDVLGVTDVAHDYRTRADDQHRVATLLTFDAFDVDVKWMKGVGLIGQGGRTITLPLTSSNG